MLSKRQNEIVEKSILLISEAGIQGLTIKNLSKKLHISEPAIYRHFSSKTEILITILDSFKNFAENFSRNIKNSNLNSLQKIRLLFTQLFSNFSTTPPLVSVIFSEEIFKNDELFLKKISAIMRLNQSTIEHIISEGQKKGEIRSDVSCDALAIIIMGTIRVLVKKWDVEHYGFDLEAKGLEIYSAIEKLLTT
jgi:AcrR family transcriptional regulator